MNQRVVIAMALAKDPTLLVLDEPTTGLDATVEGEVLDLVAALRKEFSTSVLFISHSLDVIARMCDRVGVLYAGRLVEEGPVDEVFHNPRHPYAVGLLRCIPRGGARKDEGRLDSIPGFLPGLGEELPACVFAERCGLAEDICRQEEPPPYDVGKGHFSRCHFHEKAHTLPRTVPEAGVTAERHQNGDAIPIIRTQNVRKTFHQEGHEVQGRGGRHLRAGAGRDARPGGRVGQRQDDVWPACCSGSPSPTRAPWSSSTAPRWRAPSVAATASRCARCRSSSRTPTRR